MRIPKYRKHKASKQAVVTLSGKDHYLGPHGSKASRLLYDRLIAEWLAAGRIAQKEQEDVTIAAVCLAYVRWGKQHYRYNGKPTGTLETQKPVIKAFRQMYGDLPAYEFSPLKLEAFRLERSKNRKVSRGQHAMVDHEVTRRGVNREIATIKQVFKWAVSKEMVPHSVFAAISTVGGLKAGRTELKETDRILPVEESVITATLEHLPDVPAAMVRLQRFTGARPGEIIQMRPCDIDRNGAVWLYRPETHKNHHRGLDRVICIGPRAQAVLTPYLLRDSQDYCFSPAESERKRYAKLHDGRTTPLSCGNRPKARPRRVKSRTYTNDSYRRVVHRACDKAKVERWSPNRLRHSAATEIRKQFGLDHARTTLGHTTVDMTLEYAERDLQQAIEVARKLG